MQELTFCILGTLYYLSKRIIRYCIRPLSKVKTCLLHYVYSEENLSFSEKSASDNRNYPELALSAAIDIRTFSIFRRHHKYTKTLEQVDIENQMYMLINISNKDYLKIDDWNEYYNKNKESEVQ